MLLANVADAPRGMVVCARSWCGSATEGLAHAKAAAFSQDLVSGEREHVAGLFQRGDLRGTASFDRRCNCPGTRRHAGHGVVHLRPVARMCAGKAQVTADVGVAAPPAAA